MKNRRRDFVLQGIFSFLIAGTFISGCSRPSAFPKPATGEPPPVESSAESGPAWQALAVLETGEYPLWFEFSGEGPRRISSPGEAALWDYIPWPLSRFTAGILVDGSNLVLAVNREGFLVLSPDGESLNNARLFRVAESVYWDPYTIASFFMYEGSPAALLYRDDFFDSVLAPPPEQRVLVLRDEEPKPAAVRVPALEALPEGEDWEVNALRRGPDGLWYYRFVQTGLSLPGTAFYRTGDLSRAGEKISLGTFRNSARPEPASQAPSGMTSLLTAIRDAFPGRVSPVLGMISPDFSGSRLFYAGPSTEEEPFLFSGYCREGPEPLAFAVLPDGQGFAALEGGTFAFSLPALPEGFVYTGVGLVGRILTASWEEQEESAVGAAGFMVLNAEACGF